VDLYLGVGWVEIIRWTPLPRVVKCLISSQSAHRVCCVLCVQCVWRGARRFSLREQVSNVSYDKVSLKLQLFSATPQLSTFAPSLSSARARLLATVL